VPKPRAYWPHIPLKFFTKKMEKEKRKKGKKEKRKKEKRKKKKSKKGKKGKIKCVCGGGWCFLWRGLV
jgi:hypothetical protein